MTATVTQTFEQFLADRFTDLDEIRDVAKYGCIAGVNGFIYSSELWEVYNNFEDDIEQMIEDLEIPFSDLVADVNCWQMQEARERMVWICVENYCADRLLAEEE